MINKLVETEKGIYFEMEMPEELFNRIVKAWKIDSIIRRRRQILINYAFRRYRNKKIASFKRK